MQLSAHDTLLKIDINRTMVILYFNFSHFTDKFKEIGTHTHTDKGEIQDGSFNLRQTCLRNTYFNLFSISFIYMYIVSLLRDIFDGGGWLFVCILVEREAKKSCVHFVHI